MTSKQTTGTQESAHQTSGSQAEQIKQALDWMLQGEEYIAERMDRCKSRLVSGKFQYYDNLDGWTDDIEPVDLGLLPYTLYKEEKPSASYEEAVAAVEVTIYKPCGEFLVVKRFKNVGWSMSSLDYFDLAERRGYKMEIVK